jgi:crotonobetainyl-CoA:carnitine CoA-transferase CaiB-like acyl-CoA transferase
MWNNADDTSDKQSSVASSGPLSGVRVIDLTVALAGPYCTLLLGGMGAEVIKIDAPGGSDIARFNPPYVGENGLNYGQAKAGEMSLSVLDRHRNKKSITLDLKCEEGRALFIELVKQADVLVENFSVGTMERLGIDFDTLHAINPGLIYTSISALGADGPPELKGMDIIVQALSGVMEVNGFADGPPCRVGFPIADMMAPHYALSGILAALFYRTKTGKGQKIEVNLLDSLVSLLAIEHFDVLGAKGGSLRSGNMHDRLTPFGVYRSSDGFIAIAASTDAWAKALFEAMGRPDLAVDERFRTRGARAVNASAVNALIEQWSSDLPADTAVELLAGFGVSAARVRTPGEAFQDPAIQARGAVVPLRHPQLPSSIETAAAGVPIQFSECKVGYDSPAPRLGENNDEVYTRLLNIDAETLQQLKNKSVI